MSETGKKLFQPYSPDAEAMPRTEGSDFIDGVISDSMQRYLRQLGTIPKLSAEELEELGKKIIAAEERWRNALYGFAYVAGQHREFLAARDLTLLSNDIIPSSLAPEHSLGELAQWMNEIPAKISDLRAAFDSGNAAETAAGREAMRNHLAKFKLTSDILMKFHDKLAFPLGGSEGVYTAVAEESCFTQQEFRAALAEADEARGELLELREKMVEGNLRLVVRIVNQFCYKNLSVSDLVQEGNLGLMRSLEKFDFRLGHKFSTYASWWIKQSIGRALAEQFRIIRIPAHMIATIAAINRAEQRFILEHDRNPEVDEIAAMLEMPVARVSAIRKMARQTISLQSPLSVDSSGSKLEDVIPDEQTNDPAHNVSSETMNRHLKVLLDQLTPREREILILRFGLLGKRVHTLQEISEHYHISRERVRQLELQTLSKLRTPENQWMFGSQQI